MASNLRIAINGLSILNRSGTGRVVEGLLDGLSQIQPSGLHCDVLLPRDAHIKPAWEQAEHLTFHSIGPSSAIQRVLWQQIILPHWVHRHSCGVLHSPAFVAPVYGLGRTRSVITIHDLAFLRFPETVRWERRMYYRWAVLASMKKAHLIFTDSEAIRRELISTDIPDENLRVLPLGVDERFFSVPDDQVLRVRGKFNLPDRYLLTVGTIEPRKNLETLIKAHQQVPDALPLAIAGRLGWGFFNTVGKRKVSLLDYVPDEDLPGWYAGADLFLAPSSYEGFGLTVLEAMSAGCPVPA
ncbi:MAG: glycosyltransferase family 1 protein, partial [bacterium]